MNSHMQLDVPVWDSGMRFFWPEDTYLGADLQSTVKSKRLNDIGKGVNANRSKKRFKN